MTIPVIPPGYMRDPRGALIPVATIAEIDLLRDEVVKSIVAKSRALNKALVAFKAEIASEIEAFCELSAEKYGKPLGGRKGNITLTSFDGQYQILKQNQDVIRFDERLQSAKALIDSCVRRWSKDSGPELHALVDHAFQVDKGGNINTARVLGLRKLNIKDDEWQMAMQAITDAITIDLSRTYFRVYIRNDNAGRMDLLPLDIQGV